MAERRLKIIVPPGQSKVRLDKFLVDHMEGVSRSRLQKLLDAGKVTVDGKPAKAHHPVRPSENIEVILPAPKKLEIRPENIPLNIVYEDEHLLVVNKPAGMVVHPAFAAYSGTLVNALLYHCHNLSGIGGVQRPGLVHRLDKDTSGLLVVAKDDATHQHLSEQFRQRTVEREYWAVVWGHFRKKTGRIETPIGRSPKDRTRMTVLKEGKQAITEYEVLEEFLLTSLVRVKLETGRTHQIRVHFAHTGHPVFGDPTYGGRNRQLGGLSAPQREWVVPILENMPRQALHAKTLGFTHPITGQKMFFDSELPDEMHQVLQQLRSASVSESVKSSGVFIR